MRNAPAVTALLLALMIARACPAAPAKAAEPPPPVKKCVAQQLPEATITQAEEQTEQGRHMWFVALATKDGKSSTLLCSGRGQYLGMLAEDRDPDDDGVDLDPASAPPAVKSAITKHFGATPIDDLSMEVEESRFVFIAEQETNDITQWVSFSAQGEVVSIEREVPIPEIPAAVKAGIIAAHPQAKLTSASVVDDQEKKSKQYVVDVTAGKDKLEITLSPEGKIEGSEPAEDDNTPATSKP